MRMRVPIGARKPLQFSVSLILFWPLARKRVTISIAVPRIYMAANAELTQRLDEHSQITTFANEVIDIVISRDLQQEAVKSADAVDKVKCKISKSKEGILESIQGNPENYTIIKVSSWDLILNGGVGAWEILKILGPSPAPTPCTPHPNMLSSKNYRTHSKAIPIWNYICSLRPQIYQTFWSATNLSCHGR